MTLPPLVIDDRCPTWLGKKVPCLIRGAAENFACLVQAEPVEPWKKKAIVLDIDDTICYAASRGPIHPIRSVYLWILKNRPDIDLFLSTARHPHYRKKTLRQVNCYGFTGWKELFMVGNSLSDKERTHLIMTDQYNLDDPDGKGFRKARIRASLEKEGYTIIANVGDDDTDHMYGHYVHRVKLPSF